MKKVTAQSLKTFLDNVEVKKYTKDGEYYSTYSLGEQEIAELITALLTKFRIYENE